MSFPVSRVVMSFPVSCAEDPDVPGNVTISESSARYQVVTWDTPFDGNSPITGYQVFSSSSRNTTFVQIFPPLGRKRAVSVTPINETAINVTDLIPFVSYQYSVSTTNAIGTSDSSQPSNAVQTDPAGMVYFLCCGVLPVVWCTSCDVLPVVLLPVV